MLLRVCVVFILSVREQGKKGSEIWLLPDSNKKGEKGKKREREREALGWLLILVKYYIVSLTI